MMLRFPLGGLAAVLLLASCPALAQSTPEKVAPGDSSKSLSDKLDQSNGVIRPKEVDPAIEKPAPKALDSNVVKPPAGSDASPSPQAK